MDWRKAKDKKGVDWREVRGWGECMREVSARGVGSTIMKPRSGRLMRRILEWRMSRIRE